MVNSSKALTEYNLIEAAARGEFQTVKSQTELGADVHASLSTDGETALHKAIRYGDPTIVAFILGNEVDPSMKTKEGYTALHVVAAYAPEETRVVIVDLLLGYNLVERFDKHGRTPLHCATAQNNEDVISALKSFGANLEICTRDSGRSRAIHIAAENGHEVAMRRLVECGADIHSKRAGGDTALHIAAKYGHMTALLSCLSLHLPVDSKYGATNTTALHIAATSGHEDVVVALLKENANRRMMTTDKATPLHLAAARGHAGVIYALLTGKPIPPPDNPGVSKEGVRGLVDRKLLEMRDGNKQTALHLAVKSGRPEAVITLLDLGSNHKATMMMATHPCTWPVSTGTRPP